MLAVVGILVLAVGGLDKVTVVVGPLLIIATIVSILRQAGRLNVETEVPILVILVGGLILASALLPFARPRWVSECEPESPGSSGVPS